MKTIRWMVALVVCGFGMAARGEGAGKMELPQRWFYLATNLLVDKNVTEAEGLFGRAEKAGCTGVLLTDSKLARLDTLEKHYFDNVEKLKIDAVRHHLEIIPTVFPIGWSNDILGHNPNLAEGMPVKEALFVVHGGEAKFEADPPVGLKGGDFANLKLWQWHDPNVVADAGPGGAGGDKAARIDANGGNGRVMQTVKVMPWRQYHFAVKVKTKDFRGSVEAKFLVKNATGEGTKSLNFMEWEIKPTQDWTVEHLAFNSQDATELMVYVGTWARKSGSAWLAEAKLEEVGLVNVLRRAGTPLVVKKEGGEALLEGKDFAKVVDAKMGNVPWPGEYGVWHDGPAIKMTGSVAEGTRLRVSYYHPVITSTGSVMICPSEPETVALLRDQAQRVHKLFGAKQYFMGHDEIRCMNWDQACEARHLSAGEILADNVKTCTKILKETAPGATIYVWSDMFDPNHNAHGDYYLVHGDLAKSWAGLDKDVVIALWYLEKREASMKFFAERGNRMIIAGYYDAPVENMNKWLEAAAGRPAGEIVGTVYTTWGRNYKDLEGFEGVVDRWRK